MMKLIKMIEAKVFPCTARLNEVLKKPEVQRELKQRFSENRKHTVEVLSGRHNSPAH